MFYSTESFLRFAVWGMLFAISVLDYVSLKILGIQMGYTGIICMLLFGFPYFLFSYAFRKAAQDPRNAGNKTTTYIFKAFACFFEGLCQFMFFALASGVLAYITSASPRPFFDASLMAIDTSLGFNWLGYIGWVNKTPYVNTALETGYYSYFQIPFLFALLPLYKNYVRVYSIMLCCIITALLCLLTAAIFPATSYYTFLHLNAADYPNVNMISGYWHVDDLLGMRAGTLKTLDLLDLKGIITFPSFHASMALIFCWGFWPMTWLRVPFLVLNLLMLLSVPVTGGHYLADVLGGLIIMAGVIFMVKRIVKYADNRFQNPTVRM